MCSGRPLDWSGPLLDERNICSVDGYAHRTMSIVDGRRAIASTLPTMCPVSRRRVLALAIIAGLSLGASRDGVAACQTTCTQQLVACRQTCPVSGRGRRDCRAACAKRSTCTAAGARIRTLAYVVSECTTAQGRSSLKQKLLVRRGNCDPVVVMEAATPTPVSNPEICRILGQDRIAMSFISVGLGRFGVGVFQAIVVLPNGSGVIFDVSKQFRPALSGLTPEPPEEGIFFVRADGSRLRRLGPPSRVPPAGFLWAASPDGRAIAFIDLGPDRNGHDGRQVFLLNLRSDDHTPRQLTKESWPSDIELGGSNPGVWFPTFLDDHTVGFYVGSTSGNPPFTASQVETDGLGRVASIPPFDVAGGGIVPRFAVTGPRPHAVLGLFPHTPAANNGFVREVFVTGGRNAQILLQLTSLNRHDTSPGADGTRGVVARGRVFFLATDPNGEQNPHSVCQLFSIGTLGEDLRQLTHLPWDGRPTPNGCTFPAPGCGILQQGLAADPVTGTVLFSASCDPFGTNPFGTQIFAMRADGTGLRQLTDARGMTTDPDGTVHVELAGPFAYTTPGQP